MLTGTINAINLIFFFVLIEGNLDPAELAANDLGRRYTGSEDTAHMARAQLNTFSCHTFPDKPL